MVSGTWLACETGSVITQRREGFANFCSQVQILLDRCGKKKVQVAKRLRGQFALWQLVGLALFTHSLATVIWLGYNGMRTLVTVLSEVVYVSLAVSQQRNDRHTGDMRGGTVVRSVTGAPTGDRRGVPPCGPRHAVFR